MPLATRQIDLFRNDTPTLPFDFFEADGVTAFDLTNLTSARFMAKSDIDLADADAIFDVLGVVDGDPTNGEINFTLAAADTAQPGKYTGEVEFTMSGGVIRTAWQGDVVIAKDVRQGA